MEAEAKSTLWPLVKLFLWLFHPSVFFYRSLMISNGWWRDGQRLAVTSGENWEKVTDWYLPLQGRSPLWWLFLEQNGLHVLPEAGYPSPDFILDWIYLNDASFVFDPLWGCITKSQCALCRQLTLQIVLGSLLGHNTGLSPAYNKNFEFPPFQECRRRRGCSNCLSLERGLPVRVGEQVLGSCSQQGDETQLNSRPDDGAVIHAITTFGEVFFKLSHCNPSLSNSLIDCTTRWTATHQTQTKQRAPSATSFAPSAGLSCFFWTSSKTIFRLKSQFTGNTRSTKRTMLQEYQESW